MTAKVPQIPIGEITDLRPLRACQESALAYLERNLFKGQGGALWMEMRLGKTLSMIRFLSQNMRAARPVLVVCPLEVIDVWARELQTEGIYNYAIVYGSRSERLKALDTSRSWYIINIDYVESLEMHLYQWGSVVLDESIDIANPKSRRSKYMRNAFLHIKYRYALCGLPDPESEMQLFTQMAFVFGAFMGCSNFWSWQNKHYKQYGYEWLPLPGTVKAVHAERHSKAFCLTRKQAGIKDPKVYSIRYTQLNAKQKKAYNAVLHDAKLNGEDISYAVKVYSYLLDICAGFMPKTGEVLNDARIKDIERLLRTDLRKSKCLIWLSRRAQIEYAAKRISQKYRVAQIHGDVPRMERDQINKDFSLGLYDHILLTLQSGNKGRDWSTADTAIYYSNVPSNDKRQQSEDRIILADNSSNGKLVLDYCTRDTLEEDMLSALKDKKINSKMFQSKMLSALRDAQEV